MAARKATDIEILRLKPTQMIEAIRAMMRTAVVRGKKGARALFVWGPPGTAKSQVGQFVATEDGIAFIDLRLSQMDPTDLRGIPYPVKRFGLDSVRWAPPEQLPRDIDLAEVVEIRFAETVRVHIPNPVGSNGIHYCTEPSFAAKSLTPGLVARVVASGLNWAEVGLFAEGAESGPVIPGALRLSVTGKTRAILGLEEFNSAPPSVQAAAYQLVLDRRLGEYVVPEGVFIMGMGNRETDRGVTFKMPTPIMNRFVHVEMRVDFEDWQAWALANTIHPQVVGFLSAFKEKLFQFDPGTAARGFATPRSWEYVSEILYANSDISDHAMSVLICGAVGDDSGLQFMEYRRIATDLPAARDILEGRLKKLTGKKLETSLMYALTTTMCYDLREGCALKRHDPATWANSPQRKKWTEEADNFLAFIMENFQPEICIMGAKAAVAIHKLPFDTARMKHFDRFCEVYKDFLVM